jgi:hypothetical protein
MPYPKLGDRKQRKVWNSIASLRYTVAIPSLSGCEGRLHMDTTARIHWIRALIGGFLAEACLIVVVIPVFKIFGEHALLYFVPPAALVMCFLFALWVGRGLTSRFILHGALVGVVATLLYVALTLARPEPTAYLVAHGLKILGGVGGGFVAGRRRSPAAATE